MKPGRYRLRENRLDVGLGTLHLQTHHRIVVRSSMQCVLSGGKTRQHPRVAAAPDGLLFAEFARESENLLQSPRRSQSGDGSGLDIHDELFSFELGPEEVLKSLGNRLAAQQPWI